MQLVDIFRRAISLNPLTVDTLAAAIETSRTDTLAMLEQWERIGIASLSEQSITLHSPELALNRAVAGWGQRIQSDTAMLAGMVGSVGALARAWQDSFRNAASDYLIDRIEHDDGDAWFTWWSYLFEQGAGEICAIVSNLDAVELLDHSAAAHWQTMLQRLGESGITLRLLVPSEARSGRTRELMQTLAAAGVSLRVGNAQDWFAVAPGNAALLPATWGRDRDVAALIVHHPSIVAGFEQLFRIRWDAAQPWDAAADIARWLSDPVIDLLCLGHTDDEIAAKLGLSVRSVRRRVAAACSALGAMTRLELGYRLGRAAGAGCANTKRIRPGYSPV